MREGEWNDAKSKGVGLKMLCHHCYEHLLGTSVQRLVRPALRRWDWDQERVEIVFSNDGIPSVIANIDFVGSWPANDFSSESSG